MIATVNIQDLAEFFERYAERNNNDEVRFIQSEAQLIAAALRRLVVPEAHAVKLLRAWVAGCGDEHFSTKAQCRELLEESGKFLASLKPQNTRTPEEK